MKIEQGQSFYSFKQPHHEGKGVCQNMDNGLMPWAVEGGLQPPVHTLDTKRD